MNNRWSDAARAAALAVRKARAFAANPRDKGKGEPKKGGLARKSYPMAYMGGSASFDESTGTRIAASVPGTMPAAKVPYAKDDVRGNPGKHIWIPPNGGKGTQYEDGMKDLEGKKLLAAKPPPKPNIFYSSTGPKGPLDRQTNQGIRYDPKNPDHPQSPMPPKRPPAGGGKNIPRVETGRVIIGGKRYTRVGNKLTPDEIIPGQKYKVFYQK
jgi:hypothetical protein